MTLLRQEDNRRRLSTWVAWRQVILARLSSQDCVFIKIAVPKKVRLRRLINKRAADKCVCGV